MCVFFAAGRCSPTEIERTRGFEAVLPPRRSFSFVRFQFVTVVKTMSANRFVAVLGSQQHLFFVGGQPVRVVGQVAAADANGVYFRHVFGRRHQRGHRAERIAQIVHIQPCHDDADSVVGQLAADIHQTVVEELRFVDADDIHIGRQQQDVLRRIDRRRTERIGVVRNDVLFGITHVDARFENLDPLMGELGPFQAADQLLGLARKHRPANDFDPTFPAGIFQKHTYRSMSVFKKSRAILLSISLENLSEKIISLMFFPINCVVPLDSRPDQWCCMTIAEINDL